MLHYECFSKSNIKSKSKSTIKSSSKSNSDSITRLGLPLQCCVAGVLSKAIGTVKVIGMVIGTEK